MKMEIVLDIEIGEDENITEEVLLVCTMTGFRRRFLIYHIGEGIYRSTELEDTGV